VDFWVVCAGCCGHQAILTSRDQNLDGSQRAGYMFFVEPEGVWSFWVGAGSAWQKLYGPRVEIGSWTHLRGSVDPRSREVRFYVNRRLVAMLGYVDFVPNATKPLRLGAGRSEDTPKFFFCGDLRDVAILGRDAGDTDIMGELTAAGRRSSQDSSTASVLETLRRLPEALRQSKGQGLVGGAPLAAALRWCAVKAAGSAFLAQQQHASVDFRRLALRFLESGLTSTREDEGMSVLLVTFELQATLQPVGGDQIRFNFGAGSSQFWAILLRSGQQYMILQEVDGVCSLPDTLERQRKLRPQSGWVTQKDAAMWMTALDMLAFSHEAAEVEQAVNTVFLFGYWAETGFISPEVYLAHFEANACLGRTRIRTALAEAVPGEVLENLFRDVTAEAKA